MTKEALIETPGVVAHRLPDTRSRETRAKGHEFMAHMSGQMR